MLTTDKVVEARDYYPFGLRIPGRVLATNEETDEDYTGHELDAEANSFAGQTGMHYAGARYYMSALGRWTSDEPLLQGNPRNLLKEGMGPLLGTSGYTYSLNNPANLTDPDGRCPICVAWAVFEVVSAGYDAYQAYQVHNDPDATPAEKREATRLATLSAIGPGGGYTALPNLGKRLDTAGRWLDDAPETNGARGIDGRFRRGGPAKSASRERWALRRNSPR